MPLTCLVVVEMCRPDTPLELYSRWKDQRRRDDDGELLPDASRYVRTWKGLPATRDYDRLVAFKNRDGWGTISHRRVFVNERDEVTDRGAG